MAATKKAKTTTETSIKQISGYVISKKRSGKYQVVTTKGKKVNGLDKAKVLVDAKLVQAGFPKAKEEAAQA